MQLTWLDSLGSWLMAAPSPEGWSASNALPIFLFMLIAAGLAATMIVLPMILAPSKNTPVKAMPYESGMDPIHDTRRRFDIHFHLVAIAFLLFDVELLILYPWAVASRAVDTAPMIIDDSGKTLQTLAEGIGYDRLLVFGGAMFFTLLVILGLVYEWRKGVLQWR